jgi:sulfur-carrier protein
MAIVILRYWAAAKEAAGVAEDKVSARTLADALAAGLAAMQERADADARPHGLGDTRLGDSGLGDAGLGDAGSGARGTQASSRARVDRLRQVFARSSFLIDGDPVGTRVHESVRLADAAVIEVLPPFAGG